MNGETYTRRLSCRAIAAYLLEFIYGQVSLILMQRLQIKLKLKHHLAKTCRLPKVVFRFMALKAEITTTQVFHI